MQSDGIRELEQVLFKANSVLVSRLAASAVVSIACAATARRCGRSINPPSFNVGRLAMWSFSADTWNATERGL